MMDVRVSIGLLVDVVFSADQIDLKYRWYRSEVDIRSMPTLRYQYFYSCMKLFCFCKKDIVGVVHLISIISMLFLTSSISPV